jgi:chemotaxis signal transduction protein
VAGNEADDASSGTEPEGASDSTLARVLRESNDGQSKGTRAGNADEIELLWFRLHDEHRAILTSDVTSIVVPGTICDLPDLPQYIRGVIAHHGRMLAVIDVAVLEGQAPIQEATRMLIVASGQLDAAIPVSGLHGFVTVRRDRIEPPLPHYAAVGYVTGQLVWNERTLSLISGPELLDRARVRREGVGEALR